MMMKCFAVFAKTCLVCVLALALCLPVGASAMIIADADPSAADSLQLRFAQLQQEQAALMQGQAAEKMAELERTQAEQKLLADLQSKLSDLRSNAVETLPGDVQANVNKLLPGQSTAGPLTREDYDRLLSAVSTRLAEVGSTTQSQMVVLQNFMSQYNSFLQGANMPTSSADAALLTLSRGGTMLGDDLGMNLTFALAGAAVGALVAVLVMKKGKKA